MTDLDPFIAYCAGLFEGEGHIGTTFRRHHNQMDRKISIYIRMTDKEPLELFQEFMDVGTVRGPFMNNVSSEYKDYYVYQTSKLKDVQFVIEQIYDWLSPRRRKQIDDAIAKYESWERLYRTRVRKK